MNTNYYPILLLIFSLASISCNDDSKKSLEKKNRPNIVYVLADDMGYGDIEAFNENCKIKTPYLNKLASEGMRFTDAHSPSAVCTPTRYGLITGQYSWRSNLKNGVLTGKSKALISKSTTTVASMLRDEGYHTSFIGKWHLGWDWALTDTTEFGGDGWNASDFGNLDFTKEVTHTPNDLGFDYAYGHSGSLDMAPYVYVENGRITEQPNHVSIDTGKYTWWREGPTSPDFKHNDVTPNFFRRAITQIEEQSKSDQPFFIYLALPSPHTPILPTEKWLGKSSLNPYADFVMEIDDYIGQLQKSISDAGIEENTLFIFTTDNGCSPQANFPLLDSLGHQPGYIYRGHKADIYEGGHRVPFIAKWPKVIKSKSVSNETICHTDLMATAAAMIDYSLKEDEGVDSYNLLPAMRKEELNSPIREATVHHSINGSFAIRKGDWKLIMVPGSGGWSYPRPQDKEANKDLPNIQLYNLKIDPSETLNLQENEIEKVAELKSLLIKYITEGRSTPGIEQDNEPGFNGWAQIDFIQE